MEQEAICWQCGKRLREPAARPETIAAGGESRAETVKPERPRFFRSRAKPAPATPEPTEPPLTFTGLVSPDAGRDAPPPAEPQEPAAAPLTQTMTTLTGEVVEVPIAPDPPPAPPSPATGQIAGQALAQEVAGAGFTLTFCKNCGYQNEEGIRECAKCGKLLEVLDAPPGEIVALPRAWGFDVLGVAWIILGFGAIFSGWFLLKADPAHPGQTWADYFWTGIVACAPGILIFMRHVFCKVLFWVMTLLSIMVWAVIGFLWLYVGIHITENAQIGLTWLAALTCLTAVSYFTVRTNDAFDFTF